MLYAFAETQLRGVLEAYGGDVWSVHWRKGELVFHDTPVAKIIWISNNFAIDPVQCDISTLEVEKVIISPVGRGIDVKDVEIDLSGEWDSIDTDVRYGHLEPWIVEFKKTILKDPKLAYSYLFDTTRMSEYQEEVRSKLIQFCSSVMNADGNEMHEAYNEIKEVYEKHWRM